MIEIINNATIGFDKNGTPFHICEKDGEEWKSLMTLRRNGFYVCINCGFGVMDVEGFRTK